jgi:predicted acyl esterase
MDVRTRKTDSSRPSSSTLWRRAPRPRPVGTLDATSATGCLLAARLRDDHRSLTFDTLPLAESFDILGAPVVTLGISSDKPVAAIAVRLCDVCPSGEVLRVSYGILNLTRRGGSDAPSPLTPGRRYRVRIQLNDAGARFSAGHRIRLALSTTYWPLMWPAPDPETITLYSGSLSLPVRPPKPADARLPPLPAIETAAPDPVRRKMTVYSGSRVLGSMCHRQGHRRTASGTRTRSAPPRSCNAPTPLHEAGGGFGSKRSCG